jgi:immune inhibitor A
MSLLRSPGKIKRVDRETWSGQDCTCTSWGRYADGPTACIAHPKVLKNIRASIASKRVLSTADARLARRMGLLSIPNIARTGWNDGIIYPLEEQRNRSIGHVRSARPSERFTLSRASGTLKCLVLLVDFSDNVATQTPSHFETLLFDRNNTNSMASFYHELSYGKLNVTGVVTQWIRAPKPYSFYTAGESGTGDNFPQNTPGLLQDILTEYCKTNTLADFDVNGDGFVDGLFLVHAGPGAETQSNSQKRNDMIWSHKWTLPQPFTNNGVKAFAYFTAPEDGKLGVFSHEFGHFLGLPDLYDTTYRSEGVGAWCLMAAGSWGGGGATPARLSAWCLATLDWIKPINATKVQSVALASLENDRNACYRVWTKGRLESEYFLIENRQAKGRDVSLPTSGLALWHIDESQADNTNPVSYRVGLVQADGRRDLELGRNSGDDGDLFPGKKAVKQVNDVTGLAPTTRANSGAKTGVAISSIQMRNGIVNAKLKV